MCVCVCVCVWMERHAWVYVCVEKRMLYTEKKMGVSGGRDECLCVEGDVEGETRLWACL